MAAKPKPPPAPETGPRAREPAWEPVSQLGNQIDATAASLDKVITIPKTIEHDLTIKKLSGETVRVSDEFALAEKNVQRARAVLSGIQASDPRAEDAAKVVEKAELEALSLRVLSDSWKRADHRFAFLAVTVALSRLRSDAAVLRSPVAMEFVDTALQTARAALSASNIDEVLKPLEMALPSGKAVAHRSMVNAAAASLDRPRTLDTDKGPTTMEEIVRGLVAANPDRPAKSLWNELAGTLDALGLDPVIDESSEDWRKWRIDFEDGIKRRSTPRPVTRRRSANPAASRQRITGSGLQRLVTHINK